MAEEFKDFFVEHNVLNFVVAIVVGNTFSDFIKSIISYLIMPIVIYATRETDFKSLTFQVGKINFSYGFVINTFLIFLVSSVSVYYIFVKPFKILTKDKANYQKQMADDVEKIKENIQEYKDKRKYLR